MTQLAGTDAAILPDDAPHLLVIDDDQRIRTLLSRYLSDNGFRVDVAANAEEARTRLGSLAFDLLILDVMMPGENGLDLLKSLRETMQVPILMLTARVEIDHRIRGFEGGADDYLGKPFDLNELAARTRAIARRGNGRASPHIAHGGIVLDPARRLITVNGEPVSLSRREFAVLSALMERPGVVRSKSDLEEQLYGWQEDVESNTIEVHIHHLRGKIGKTAIETVRGLGYRMGTVSP